MPDPYTKRIPDITQRLVDFLIEQKDVIGLADIYYGDQELVPRFPSASVEGFPKDRTMQPGSTHKFDLTLRCAIYLYHGKVQSSQTTRKEADEFAELVEDTLHSNFTMNGLVIFGYVTRVEPGISLKKDTMIRTTRLTWEGKSRQLF